MTAIFANNDKLEDGHYTVLKELGVGGMGVVYHCRDEFLQRDVAIKMLLPELMTDSKNVEVFTEEARLAARMEHPNLVTVYDIGVEVRQDKAHHFVAMEYLPGGNLANRTQGAALAVEHALNWMKQLANGLYFAHRKGVVHQDVKADNIFITTEGDLKIGDFGLARLMANKVYINPSTKGMGTPAYMSPELCRGEQQDQRSDIYSLGILFFEMVTGQLPYRANGMIEMAMKHTTAPIPSVRRMNSEVPDVLDRLIRRMMEKSPTDRYQSLADVLKILDDLIFDLRVARMGLGLSTKRTSQRVETITEADSKIGKSDPAKRAAPVTPKPSIADPSPSDPPPPVSKPPVPPKQKTQIFESDPKATPPSKAVPPVADKPVDKKPPQNRPQILFDDRPYISHSRIEAAGIKPLEPVGPARQPSQPVAKLDAPQISAYSIPVVDGLNPLLTQKWTFKAKGPIGWNSHPVYDDDSSIYAAAADGRLYKLNRETGDLIWGFESDEMIMASPLLRGKDLFLTTCGGKIIKVDQSSGQAVWRANLGERIVSSPATNGIGLVVGTMDGNVCCLDITDGGKVWAGNLKSPIVCNPTVYGDVVFLSTRGGRVYSLQTSNGKERWSAQLDGPVVSTPATSADSLYVGTQASSLYALDIESGQSIWEYQAGRGIVSGAVIVFTSVVFSSQDKWLYSCEKYDGRLRWKAALKGNVQAALSTAAQTVLAVSKEGWIQGFDSETGAVKWQKNFGGNLESQPLVLKDGLVIATIEGEISYYKFGIETLKKSA